MHANQNLWRFNKKHFGFYRTRKLLIYLTFLDHMPVTRAAWLGIKTKSLIFVYLSHTFETISSFKLRDSSHYFHIMRSEVTLASRVFPVPGGPIRRTPCQWKNKHHQGETYHQFNNFWVNFAGSNQITVNKSSGTQILNRKVMLSEYVSTLVGDWQTRLEQVRTVFLIYDRNFQLEGNKERYK